jgi:hypothetical protein
LSVDKDAEVGVIFCPADKLDELFADVVEWDGAFGPGACDGYDGVVLSVSILLEVVAFS